MKNKKHEVNIYFSGFCTHEIEANSKDKAIEKARKLPINKKEILSNLENWFEGVLRNKNLELLNFLIDAIDVSQVKWG